LNPCWRRLGCLPMRASIPAAIVALVVSSLADVVASATNQCNGDFECSDFDYSQESPLWSWTSKSCRYGHTEVNGNCESPCQGTRTAPCRCMTEEEAEAAVTDSAQTAMTWSAIACVASAAFVGFSLYKARMSRGEAQEQESAESADQTNETDAQEANDPTNQTNETYAQEANNPANQTIEAWAQQANEPANQTYQTYAQQGQQGANNAVVYGKSDNSILSRSRSRLEVIDARLMSSGSRGKVATMMLISPLIILAVLCYGLFNALTSERGWDSTLSDFMSVIAASLVAAWFLFRLGLYAAQHGLSTLLRVLSFSSENPIGPLIFAARFTSGLCALAPLLAAAAFLWSYNRTSNPEGVYWACDA